MQHNDRLGITSRIRHADGPRSAWNIADGLSFELPCIVDHMCVDPDTWELVWLVEAYIDLVDGDPKLVRMDAKCPGGIDPVAMQRDFRWASPVDVVTRLVPSLLAAGIDPYDHDLPLTGFPDVTHPEHRSGTRLTDAFLEDIVRRYLALGRGYADVLAREYVVSRRTVISWVEKARQRGILSAADQGKVGGTYVHNSKRKNRE